MSRNLKKKKLSFAIPLEQQQRYKSIFKLFSKDLKKDQIFLKTRGLKYKIKIIWFATCILRQLFKNKSEHTTW